MKNKENVTINEVSDFKDPESDSKESKLSLFFLKLISKLFKKKEVIAELENNADVENSDKFLERRISAFDDNYRFGMNDDQRNYFLHERNFKYKKDMSSSGCWGL